MYRILIVEDDKTIADSMKKFLESWSYEVRLIKDFNKVMEEYKDFNPDLVLMDITLPYFNGYHWCDEIRKVSNNPIIFISSANDNMNIVMAISKGADDFVTKPFDLHILLAKIQAILRRSYEFNTPSEEYEYQGVTFDNGKSVLKYENNLVDLTKNEAKILKVLFDRKEKIVSRDDLMEFLWDTDEFIDDNTLTVNINRLRKKMKELGCDKLIQTKKGQGYILWKDKE